MRKQLTPVWSVECECENIKKILKWNTEYTRIQHLELSLKRKYYLISYSHIISLIFYPLRPRVSPLSIVLSFQCGGCFMSIEFHLN